MIKELDIVVLTHDIKDHGLTVGDRGAVVHCYSDGNAYEVEFTAAEGKAKAVLTLTSDDIRPMRSREILHASKLTHEAA